MQSQKTVTMGNRKPAKAGLGSVFAASLFLLCAGALAQVPALQAYGADPSQTSVSGLSSGAYMATQLQVAYSKDIIGSGVIAGGPYYCAANSIAYTGICMGQVPFIPPNPAIMAGFARDFAKARKIDPLSQLAKRRIYVFSGTQDQVQRQQGVDAAVSFFQQVGVPTDHLRYVNDLPAGHALITPAKGNDCAANESPYISHCESDGKGYDQAGALLQHIYGPLAPPVEQPAGRILPFDQSAYAAKGSSMAATGYLYVPPSCEQAGANCRIHVALHGCVQSAESVGDKFYTETGYNRWADSNRLLVLYPQVNKSALLPFNPKGCWDWWGYSGGDYAQKSGVQMKAIMRMTQRLAQPRQER